MTVVSWDDYDFGPELDERDDEVLFDFVTILELTPRIGPWKAQARCRPKDERLDLTDAFFPGRGDDSRMTRRMCHGCRVVTDCLEYALSHRSIQGIWGGTTDQERREIAAVRAHALLADVQPPDDSALALFEA